MHPALMQAGAWAGHAMAGVRMPLPWGAMANGGPPPDVQWSMAGAGPGMVPTPGSMFGHGYGPASHQSHGTNAQSPSSQSLPNEAAPSKPFTIVVAWNLSPEYTRETLKNELLDIDFHPEKCDDLPLAGAFVLWFSEVWHAEALIVSLDDTEEHLSPRQGERLRLARWTSDSPSWGAKEKAHREVPAALQQVLPEIVQADRTTFSSGGSGLEWK